MMEVKKISPQGYCKGVILAIKKVLEVINNPSTPRPIYLLGMIIHNRFVCSELERMGVTILEGINKLQIIDNINDGTIIISAHGVSNKVKNKIIEKGLNLVDTTCPDVKKVHDNVLNFIYDGYEVLYIGKKNHPEALGVLEESNKIHLLNDINNLIPLEQNKKYYVTNQTTLSHDYILTFHNKIKELTSNVVLENNICLATTKREVALHNITTDLIVVVGDYGSSNTQKLVEIAKNKAHAKAVIAIERARDLLNYDLTKYNEAYVTSGASTPSVMVDEVVKFLQSNGKDLTILSDTLLIF